MTKTSASLVNPVFEAVVEFLDGLARGEHPPLAEERKRLVKVLNAFVQESNKTPETAAFRERVFAPLVYWIDEVLTFSSWESASEWPNHILELEYLGPPRKAFSDFWTRAAAAEKAAADQDRRNRASRTPHVGDDALETIFHCVAMGFRGKYFGDAPELIEWVGRVRPLIEAEPADPRRSEPPEWGLGPLPGDWLLIRGSWLVSASVLLALVGFMAAVHAGLRPS